MCQKEPVLTRAVNTLGSRAQRQESVQSLAVNPLLNMAVLNANQDSDCYPTEAANKVQSRAVTFMPLMDFANPAKDHSTPNIPVSALLWDAQK